MGFTFPTVGMQIDLLDYENDGILYCGKCNTPKQCKITLFGKTRLVPCLCQCEKEKLREEENQKRETEFKNKSEEIRRQAFQDGRMREWTFAKDDRANPEISKKMNNYAQHFKDFYEKAEEFYFLEILGLVKPFSPVALLIF